MKNRRILLVAVVVAALLLTAYWLQQPRPDHRFVVLGAVSEVTPVQSGISSDALRLGQAVDGAISNAFLPVGEDSPSRAGCYEWSATAWTATGELATRRGRFREGAWNEVRTEILEREVRDGFGAEVVSYQLQVRGAITPDGAQWHFWPLLSSSGRGEEDLGVELHYDELARRLRLQLTEVFDGGPAEIYEFSFAVGMDGSIQGG